LRPSVRALHKTTNRARCPWSETLTSPCRTRHGDVNVSVLSESGETYFFQGASGNDKPESKTMRSLDSTPSGNPLVTYANIA